MRNTVLALALLAAAPTAFPSTAAVAVLDTPAGADSDCGGAGNCAALEVRALPLADCQTATTCTATWEADLVLAGWLDGASFTASWSSWNCRSTSRTTPLPAGHHAITCRGSFYVAGGSCEWHDRSITVTFRGDGVPAPLRATATAHMCNV